MSIRLILILLMATPQVILAEPNLKGSPSELESYLLDNRKIVTISGEAKESAEADNAVVSVVVKTKEEKLANALRKNKDIRIDIRKQLMKKGIDTKNIKFAKFSSTPQYGWFGDKPNSYTISNEVKITIKTEEEFESIASIVDSMEEVYFTRTKLEHTTKDKSQEKVLDKALDKVMLKKKKYEDRLGIKLIATRVLEENIFEGQPEPVYAEERAKRKMMDSSYSPASGVKSSGFGEIIYRAFTRVEFIVVK